MKIKAATLALILAATVLCNTGAWAEEKISPEEAKQVAKEAFIYGFPMVVHYKTMFNYAVDENSPEYKGGFGNLDRDARVYTPDDKAIVSPNSDTPYCMLWADLRSEPIVYTIPKMEENRYYTVQLVDMYTHNFDYISATTKGHVAGKYLIAGPDWNGEKPEGISEIVRCPTPFLFANNRTQLFGAPDLDRMKELQREYKVEPLSEFQGEAAPARAPAIDFPKWNEGDQFTVEAFGYIDFMLSISGKTLPGEEELMKRFAKINIGTADKFALESFSPEIQEALAAGAKEGFAEAEAFIASISNDPLMSAKLFGTAAFLKKIAKEAYQLDDHYMLRFAGAHVGLYGNSGEEAVYPVYGADSDGKPLNASDSHYTLTLKAGDFPPVNAFWSLTMYDGKTQLLIENPLDRYLVNSPMMDDFVKGEDGSLTFYIQKDSPGKDLEPNWLPAPDGPFYAVLRLYGPKEAILKGEWKIPQIEKAN